MVDLSQCAAPTTSTTSTTAPGPAITTTTTATGPGATPSTVPGVTTTSTTVPCGTVRCLLDAGLQRPPCAGETIPPTIRKNFDRAIHLVEQAGGSAPTKVRRLLKHARRAIGLADHAAKKAARGKKPKLTVACAAAVEGAAKDVRNNLGE